MKKQKKLFLKQSSWYIILKVMAKILSLKSKFRKDYKTLNNSKTKSLLKEYMKMRIYGCNFKGHIMKMCIKGVKIILIKNSPSVQ